MRKAETFTALNGLRFLAALAVVIFHYAPRVAAYGRVPEVLKNLIDEGPAAVGFFFILSGFVLAHRHLYGEARIRNRAAFYWARFARLYPAYLLAFLLFLPIAADRYVLHPSPAISGRHTFLLSGILSCLMLQSWTPLAQAWNGPSWSLSVEVFLYFMFPLIGVRLVTLSRRGMAGMLLVSWLIPAAGLGENSDAHCQHAIRSRYCCGGRGCGGVAAPVGRCVCDRRYCPAACAADCLFHENFGLDNPNHRRAASEQAGRGELRTLYSSSAAVALLAGNQQPATRRNVAGERCSALAVSGVRAAADRRVGGGAAYGGSPAKGPASGLEDEG